MPTISYLADHPEFIPELAAALQREWSWMWPDRTLEWRIDRLKRHMHRRDLPIAWVAHENTQLLGTASLRSDDVAGVDHLSPWLGGVFVLPSHRGTGIGAQLCKRVEDAAALGGTSRLYLGTLRNLKWYIGLGWTQLDVVQLNGHTCDIMYKDLP